MLNRDRDVFESTFTDAAEFVRAAELRKECFALCSHISAGVDTPWEKKRAAELLQNAPACKEQWFVDQLVRDFGMTSAWWAESYFSSTSNTRST